MRWFTCGSTQPLDYSKYDGVVAGYHLSLWHDPLIFDIPGKVYRSQFLYGNKHHKPCPKSGCETIAQWVSKRVGKFPHLDEWVLINEFTDDLGTAYPNYKLSDLKRYCEAAHTANPQARLILGDFKPYLPRKWEAIAYICHALKKEGFPIEVGIQTHLKHYNASVVLARLPEIIRNFEIPVHFIEASLWYRGMLGKGLCKGLWAELEDVARSHNVASFCPWWLHPEDVEVGRRMPTFEGLSLFLNQDYTSIN